MTKYLSFQYSDRSGNFFTFQQDSAPTHRARETVQLLTCETSDFIAPALWSANSPDSWPEPGRLPDEGKLQERVYRSRIHDVDPIKEW